MEIGDRVEMTDKEKYWRKEVSMNNTLNTNNNNNSNINNTSIYSQCNKKYTNTTDSSMMYYFGIDNLAFNGGSWMNSYNNNNNKNINGDE